MGGQCSHQLCLFRATANLSPFPFQCSQIPSDWAVCAHHTQSHRAPTPSAPRTERWKAGRSFWKHQEFCWLYQIGVEAFMPDRATVAAPGGLQMGRNQLQSQQKLTWNKKIIQTLSQLLSSNTNSLKMDFLKPYFKAVLCSAEPTARGLYIRDWANTGPWCFIL